MNIPRMNQFSCTLIHETETLLASESKTPNILSAGTHTFPFSFVIPESLPTVVSSRPVNINYQVTASVQLLSLLPFSSPYHCTKSVILLQKDEDLHEDLFNTTALRLTSKGSVERFSGQVSFPCKVLPQSGTIPLMLNLSLKGNATEVKKLTIELLESVYVLAGADNDGEEPKEILVDERLVSRQNCPIRDWPASTTEEPVMIPKRLMFKVPQSPLSSSWSSSSEQEITATTSRTYLEKGICHTSGRSASANIRVAHSIRVHVQLQGLTCDVESVVEYDSAESETEVMIVGHQEYKEDESHPPSYYRSFTTKLVEGNRLHEMDRQAIEALSDEVLYHGGGNTMSLPSYDDIFACARNSTSSSRNGSSSSSASPRVMSWAIPSQISLDQYSLAESTTSNDSYLANLAAYTARYSNGSSASTAAVYVA
ncbi:hypothetical protein BGZ83_000569 [Gryganskiella cystojenkinii]|nr:hypothetical protein BGZ83_000569 [Gryganskiella cystojenkinii]